MTRILLGLLSFVIWINFASAQTPPEVLEPYKQYRTALEAGDNNAAYKSAKEAWKAAEKILGDHKTTGDLAANFANLTPPPQLSPWDSYQTRMKAHERAIELAKYHEE